MKFGTLGVRLGVLILVIMVASLSSCGNDQEMIEIVKKCEYFKNSTQGLDGITMGDLIDAHMKDVSWSVLHENGVAIVIAKGRITYTGQPTIAQVVTYIGESDKKRMGDILIANEAGKVQSDAFSLGFIQKWAMFYREHNPK